MSLAISMAHRSFRACLYVISRTSIPDFLSRTLIWPATYESTVMIYLHIKARYAMQAAMLSGVNRSQRLVSQQTKSGCLIGDCT